MVFVSSILTLQQILTNKVKYVHNNNAIFNAWNTKTNSSINTRCRHKEMKYTYTHINGNIIEKTTYKISKNNKVFTNKIQYELDNINVKNNKLCTKH